MKLANTKPKLLNQKFLDFVLHILYRQWLHIAEYEVLKLCPTDRLEELKRIAIQDIDKGFTQGDIKITENGIHLMINAGVPNSDPDLRAALVTLEEQKKKGLNENFPPEHYSISNWTF